MKSFLRVCFMLNTVAVTLVLLLRVNSMRAFMRDWTSPILIAHVVLAILVWRQLLRNANHLENESLLDDSQVTPGMKSHLNRRLVVAHMIGLVVQVVWLTISAIQAIILIVASSQRDYAPEHVDFSGFRNAFFLAELAMIALGICAFVHLYRTISPSRKEEPLDLDF